jgi:hypothetical protein
VLRLEDALHSLEHREADLLEFGAAVVDGRAIDGAQDAVRHVRGSRDLEEMAAGSV